MDAASQVPEDRCRLPARWQSGAVLVCAAIVLGVFLRLDGINSKSFWFDEVWTAYEISEPSLTSVWRGLDKLPVAPLYYASLYTWVSVWGMSDISLRALSVFYSLLTLPVTYITWRHLVGRRAMSWTLALLALNSYQVAYSQDAKMYSMLWLLATASSGCFLNALSERPGRKWWLTGYGIASACLPLSATSASPQCLSRGFTGYPAGAKVGTSTSRCSTPARRREPAARRWFRPLREKHHRPENLAGPGNHRRGRDHGADQY